MLRSSLSNVFAQESIQKSVWKNLGKSCFFLNVKTTVFIFLSIRPAFTCFLSQLQVIFYEIQHRSNIDLDSNGKKVVSRQKMLNKYLMLTSVK